MNVPQCREAWERKYVELAEFRQTQGHCLVTPGDGAEGLGTWLEEQRMGVRRGRVVGRRRRLLLALGVRVNLMSDVQWLIRFRELRRYRKAEGCLPQYLGEKATAALYHWLVVQRAQFRKGRLEPWRIQMFERFDIPFVAEARPEEVRMISLTGQQGERWLARCEEMARFRATHGHGRVPADDPALASLHAWCNTQRMARVHGRLAPDRLQRLEEAGFEWHPWDHVWEQRWGALKAFHVRHGHFRVPWDEPEFRSLYVWVTMQRRSRVLGELAPERERRLTELGLVWSPLEEQWQRRVAELAAFKAEHGHCVVRGKSPLAHWAVTQRKRQRQGRMPVPEEACLTQLGFCWENPPPLPSPLRSRRWEARFQQLLTYRARHGHCNVEEHEETEWPGLGSWVASLRRRYKNNGLLPERARRLEEAGFVWSRRDTWWAEQFAKLEAFRREHGHCRVPYHQQEHLSLRSWLTQQLQLQRRGQMEPERLARLQALGGRPGPSQDRRAGGDTTAVAEAAELAKDF